MGFIYCITNDLNNKKYVGQTRVSVNTRFKSHINDYNNYDKCALHLAIQKYGEEHFSVETLEECDDSLLDDREIYWIEKLDTYHNGYNSTVGGQSRPLKYDYKEIANKYLELRSYKETANYFNCSYIVVKEACTLYNIPDFSNHFSEENIKKMFDWLFNNNFNVPEAAKKFNCSTTAVYYNLKKYGIDLKSEQDKYIISSYKKLGSISKTAKATGRCNKYISKVLRENNIPRISHKITKQKIAQYDLNGKLIKEYESMSEASRELNIDIRLISRACNGKANTAHGYKWKKIEND